MERTIKEAAETYVPKSGKNITELETVDVSLFIRLETGKDSSGDEYSFNYVEINGEKYRVPDSILKDLQEVLKKKPNLTKFSVSKSGEGRQTRYTLIPMD